MRVGTACRGLIKSMGLALIFFGLAHLFFSPNKSSLSRSSSFSSLSPFSTLKVDASQQRSLESIITSKLIKPASNYNLSSDLSFVPDLNRDMAQLAATLSHQKDLCGSERRCFYVEYGANDGEWFSHSLILEVTQEWEGLLIEPSPELFNELVKKGRRATSINSCLSSKSNGIETQTFYYGNGYSRFSFRPEEELAMSEAEMKYEVGHLQPREVTCFPLFAILHALKRTRVDLLALDADGRELSILRTLPWEELDVRLVLITRFWTQQQGQSELLRRFLAKQGLAFLQNLAHLAVFIKQ